MPNNLPGGRVLSAMGSYINVISPYNGSMTRLDVLVGDLEKKIRMWRKAHSGSLLAVLSRAIAVEWSWPATVWWDIFNHPEGLMLNSGWGCGMQVGIGSYAGQAAYGATQQQFWMCPSGILSYVKMHQNSQGEEQDGIVTADIVVSGNSLIFLLPDELSAYNTYVQELQALGQFQGLGAFTTMQ